jgi:hypothetical protein
MAVGAITIAEEGCFALFPLQNDIDNNCHKNDDNDDQDDQR